MYPLVQAILFIIFLIIIIAIVRKALVKRKKTGSAPAQNLSVILEADIAYFQRLSEPDKKDFIERCEDFLQSINITPVHTELNERDRVYIAAGAIIPIFGFKNWRYHFINEILVYPSSFSEGFKQAGEKRNILGMVGDGAMHRSMILSLQSIRSSFQNRSDAHNTIIHEFVHLVDKEDGDIDGIPDALLPHKLSLPWLRLMQEETERIKKGKSGLNDYAATNPAEFFAVASEYFFEQPGKMQDKFPELYSNLEQIFRQDPAV